MPASIAMKTVYGQILASDEATPVPGRLRFVPSATVYDVTGNIVVAPVPLFATLDADDGTFSIGLLATDDPDANPQGWVWLVTEMFAGGREYAIQVPVSSPSSVPLAELTPVVDVDLTYAYATLATVQALSYRMDALEVEAGVRHSDEFTASGTWVCPVGVYAVDLEVVGAGGGGGGGGGSAGGYGSDASLAAGVRGGGGGSGGGVGVRRFIESVTVVPLTSYAVVVGAGGTAGVGGAGGSAGSDASSGTNGAVGVDGTAGGYSQALGYRSLGGLAGMGGTNGSATSDNDFKFAVPGGASGGGAGGAHAERGGYGGSYGLAGEDRPYDVSNSSPGGAASIVSGDLPGGGAGGGGGGRGGFKSGSSAGMAGARGGGGKPTVGVLGGTPGAAGSDAAASGGGGATAGSNGVAGEAAGAVDHPGGGGHGGGGGSGAGQGFAGNGGSGAPGGAGSNGGPGVVRISY